jgi:hypothetical protein
VSAGRLSGWERSVEGAVLAASYFAVAADRRMPPRVWRPVLANARPPRSAIRLERAWSARVTAGAAGRTVDMDVGAVQVWRPAVSVVGVSGVSGDRDRVVAGVWARTDDGRTWRVRRVRVSWTSGDWRLGLPLRPWRVQPPDERLRPLAAGVPGGAR